MISRPALTLLATIALALPGVFGGASTGVAQSAQDHLGTVTDASAQAKHKGKAGPARSAAPSGRARSSGPRHVGPRTVGPKMTGPKMVAPKKIVGPKAVGPKTVGPKIVGPKTVGPKAGRMGSLAIRDANRARVAGRNYSIWRGSHRIRRHGHWRTFVGLGTLSAIVLGTAYYYPYAYIDAPAPYCEGLTADGCELRWQAVPTLEGPVEYVCVAYCPWQ